MMMRVNGHLSWNIYLYIAINIIYELFVGITEKLYMIQDDIVRIRRLIADAIQNWNHK